MVVLYSQYRVRLNFVKTLITDLSFQNFLLNVEGRKCLLQNIFSNHRTTFFSQLPKNFFLPTSFLGKSFIEIIFQYFQLKSHSCGYEGMKAFTEHYGSDDLQKWSQNISRQNSKLSLLQDLQCSRFPGSSENVHEFCFKLLKS